MKLTAAKFALFVFVLLALGMFVAAVPQGSIGDATDDTGTTSPIGGDTNDSPSTPSTGKTDGGTTTGGGKTGTDTGKTDGGSTTKTPGKSTDEEPSDPPSRTGSGSKTTDEPANGDDNTSTGNNDATPKTSQGSGNAKNNNNGNDDNVDGNNDNNSNNGNNRNGNDNNRNRNSNNNNNADSNDNAKGAKNADTTDNNNHDEPTDGPDASSSVAQPTDTTDPSESPDNEPKLALNATCTSNDSCDSGLCTDGKCSPKEKEDDDKIGKTLGMGLGIIVAVMCIGMVGLTAVRMMLKRRRSDYYSKRISEIAAPSRATTPSFYHDKSSLVLEKQARNGNYAFQSPEAAISSDSVRPPAQGYYGAADGYDLEQSYTRTGMPNYANDQHLYAPNAPVNDWSVTPTYGAFPTTAAPDPNPIPVPQPTMLPAPAMSPIPPRNVQPAADPRSNGSNAFGDFGGAGERDSELIMYGGASSQNLTRESMYDASDDQQNDGGRYKMNSIYSAYGRDSLYADTKDTPSVPDVPDLPSQYQK